MGETLAAARQVAGSPGTTVAILGESGVGKEVLARAIHVASGKDMTSFVAVNCAAIPETLLEERVYEPVGSDRPVRADFRIIAATRPSRCPACPGPPLT